jgi:hypothetical protein
MCHFSRVLAFQRLDENVKIKGALGNIKKHSVKASDKSPEAA